MGGATSQKILQPRLVASQIERGLETVSSGMDDVFRDMLAALEAGEHVRTVAFDAMKWLPSLGGDYSVESMLGSLYWNIELCHKDSYPGATAYAQLQFGLGDMSALLL